VLPENDPLNDSLRPSSASVFVKYAPKSSVRQNVTQIKHLVLNGVEGLTLEKVSVVTVPAMASAALPVPTLNILGIRLYRDGASTLLWFALGAMPVLLAAGYFAGNLLVRRRKPKPVASGKDLAPVQGLASL
jgi:type III secretion protein J